MKRQQRRDTNGDSFTPCPRIEAVNERGMRRLGSDKFRMRRMTMTMPTVAQVVLSQPQTLRRRPRHLL